MTCFEAQDTLNPGSSSLESIWQLLKTHKHYLFKCNIEFQDVVLLCGTKLAELQGELQLDDSQKDGTQLQQTLLSLLYFSPRMSSPSALVIT